MDLVELKHRTQIDKTISLQDDRANELSAYYQKSKEEIIALYKSLNVEVSSRQSRSLFGSEDPSSIVSSYLDDIFLNTSITRLMLHYDRLAFAHSAISTLSRFYPSFSGVRFIDYGAGAADYALAFATLGASITILDLAGGPIEFASHRFKMRDIPHFVIKVTETDFYPKLPQSDIINATEVLEHVPDPLRVLLNIWQSLSTGGFFLFSDYPMQAKSVGGAHLKSAADLREAAKSLLHLLFEPVYYDEKNKYVYIFRKRG